MTLAPELKPVTAAEGYWAARALKAEALLAAGEAHQRELRAVALSEEAKRKVC